jgi:hypothetical protein
MSPLGVFALQFLWFLLAWSAIAAFLVAPRLRDVEPDTALSIWVTPHLFRVLGLGLLVPSLAPGMPATFAVPTAAGDAITALLAFLSLWALHRQWKRARTLVWVFNVFGSADLLVALVQAVRVDAASYLQAQWYVAALGVPLMLVAHVMVFHGLLARPESVNGPDDPSQKSK